MMLPQPFLMLSLMMRTVPLQWDLTQNGMWQQRGASQRTTAIIQLAFGNKVYVLQVGQLLADHQLPQTLKMLLADHHVKKVGRLVDSDLCFLQKEVNSSRPFVGGIDLAKLAKEH